MKRMTMMLVCVAVLAGLIGGQSKALGSFSEDFEGSTFLPAGWTAYTKTSTWVNKSVGHDGVGGDGGYAAALDDYNPSGWCGISSAAYDTVGLAGIGFDFNNRYGGGSVISSFDMTSDAGFLGAFLNWAGGEVLYYNNGWNYVMVGDERMSYNTTQGQWQRVTLTPSEGWLQLTVEDVTTGATQASEWFPMTTIGSVGTDNTMFWYTETTQNFGYNIDNVWAAVPEPGVIMLLVAGLGLMKSRRRK